MKTGICLNMIIKNEAHLLPRLFASLHTVVDYYVISDTGSTDNSIELVKELGKKYKIEGIIESHPWVDFSHNRNIALEMANIALREHKHQCKWWLAFDPDEELIIHDTDFAKKLNSAISYQIPKTYKNFIITPLLLMSFEQKEWRWQGAIHNHLENTSDNKQIQVLEGLNIKCHLFEGNKSKAFANQKEKSIRDAELLEIELKECIPTSTNIQRYFSLANEYHEAQQIEKAIVNFNIVVQHQNLAPKATTYFAHLQLGSIYFEQYKDQSKAFEYYTKAAAIIKNRKEAFYFMAKIHLLKKEYTEANRLLEIAANKARDITITLAYNDIYLWKVDFDTLLVKIQLKQWSQAKMIFNQLIRNNNLPLDRRKILLSLGEKYFFEI